jgi:hypothetical protein
MHIDFSGGIPWEMSKYRTEEKKPQGSCVSLEISCEDERWTAGAESYPVDGFGIR